MPSETEIAWLAGLLEGEGCFTLQKSVPPRRPNPSVTIYLKMTDEDVVRRAATLLGTKSVRKLKSPSFVDKGYKDSWVTTISGAAAANRMRELQPHMGARRQARIAHVLSVFDSVERAYERPVPSDQKDTVS